MGTGINNNWWLGKYISNGRFTWRKRFIWWPQRSYESNKRIWLQRAWYGYKWVDGPGSPAKIERWLTEKEYVFHLLKSN